MEAVGGFSILGDSLAIARLGFDLYTKVYQVFKYAKEDFADLKNNLRLIKDVLGAIQSLMRNGSEEWDTAIRPALERCSDTLKDLEIFIGRFQELSETNRNIFFKRLEWAKEEKMIRQRNQRLMDCFYPLQMALLAQVLKELSGSRSMLSHQGADGDEVAQSMSAGVPAETDDDNLDDVGELSRGSIGARIDKLWRKITKPGWKIWPPLELEALDDRCSDTKLKDLKVKLKSDRRKPLFDHRMRREFQSYTPQLSDMNIVQCLRVATWWLLKSREEFCRSSYQSSRGTASDQVDETVRPKDHPERLWEHDLDPGQAMVDLLKSSWILEEVILSDQYEEEIINQIEWSMIESLAEATSNDLRRKHLDNSLEAIYGAACDERFANCNKGFMEDYDHLIAWPVCFRNADSIEDPHRWLRIDRDTAGTGDEVCMRRYFVNAALGPRNSRRKSTSLPYMLVLWYRSNRCKIFISLIDQHGVLNYQRKLSLEDRELQYRQEGVDNRVIVDFPSDTEAVLKFWDSADRSDFLGYVTAFFDATMARQTRQGEYLIGRWSLTSYELSDVESESDQRSSRTFEPVCEVSLLGVIPNDCSKIQRRLVVSSKPKCTGKTFCKSVLLPTDRVGVQKLGSRLSLKWSHVNHLSTETDGYYAPIYSLIWKPHEPNRFVELVFKDETSVDEFMSYILDPFTCPNPSEYNGDVDILGRWKIDSELVASIYRLHYTDQSGQQIYKAIVICEKRRYSWQISHIYFLYDKFDFSIHDNKEKFVLHFPNSLYQPDMKSNQVGLPNRPPPSEHVEVSKITKALCSAEIIFDKVKDRTGFFNALLGGEMTFSTANVWVNIKRKRQKWRGETYAKASIVLWQVSSVRENGETRLAIRVDQTSGPLWMTAAMTEAKNWVDWSMRKRRVVLHRLILETGMLVDSHNLQAFHVEPSSANRGNQEWILTIKFWEEYEYAAFEKAIKSILSPPKRVA